ncbi:hypothetical protein AAFF_G00307470 [Aldrovandia affinis]|uniref:Ig-like domain-containing protein n=1 Tax=Aldrovandia affinis TaxID=143900 RepID=A0AAD7RAG5_9TELE|nr:hypothetical protein AAFF_G00307470 [Aldrovandia affinis]
MIIIEAGLKLILLFLLSDLPSAVETEVKTMIVREGETVTLNSHLTELKTDSQILWSFDAGSSYIIGQLFSGQIKTEFAERFRDRLELDRQIGSLTISNLNTKDSGVYQIQTIISGKISLLKFKLTVYPPVSKPLIRNITQSLSANQSQSAGSKTCSVLCSVKNGREVTLSWQRGGETLNHTISPDLNTPLSLPLDILVYTASYSCVAKNPVSTQTVLLNTEEFCPQYPGPEQKRHNILTAVLISVVLFAIVIGLFFVRQLNSRESELEDDGQEAAMGDDVIYAEVRTGTLSKETKILGGTLSGLDSEAEESIVYAHVRT